MSDPSFSDEEAQRILERAIELDAVSGTPVRLDRLRQIALELGVSDAALEHALRERAIQQPAEAMSPRVCSLFGWSSTRVALSMPLIGGALGVAAACSILSLGMIAAHRDGREQLPLQAGLGGLWAGHLAGFSVIYGSVWGDAVGVLGLWWAGFALTGAAVPVVRKLLTRFRRAGDATARAI